MRRLLIVVDMQNDFISGSLGTKEAVNIVNKVIQKINNFEGDILFTRDTHFNNYLSTSEGKKLPVEHCIIDTKGWKIEDRINKIRLDKGCQTFDKHTFGSKDLAKYVEKLNLVEKVDEIHLVGLCTDICVISNALLLKAVVPETDIIVDADCCAGVNEESHNNALNAMKMCQISIHQD